MTLEQLGAIVGRSKGALSRIESGETMLKFGMAEKIAGALDVSVAEVLGLDAHDARRSRPPAGFSDDLVPYEPPQSDPIGAYRAPNRYLLEVTTDLLDRIGIAAGDVVVVTDDRATCEAPPPLSAVRVRWHPEGEFMQPKTLLRQFVPPSLLITNASKGNLASLDIEHDDVHIVGVVVRSIKKFGR